MHIDSEDYPLPNNMSVKEGKSLSCIHGILMAPLAGVDNNGQVQDEGEFRASVADLSK
jgi:hypothetical protein